MVEQGRAEPEAVGVRPALLGADDRLGAAVDLEGGALGDAAVEVGRHLVAVDLGDQRAHLGAFVAAGADGELADAVLDLRDELVADRVDRDQGGDRHAALPR